MAVESRWTSFAVWCGRIIVGLTFIVSGWAKAIDPWGTILKLGEYTSVWGWAIPHEILVAGAIGLAVLELLTGVTLAVGAYKHLAPIVAAAMMAVMLPLTVYIAIANPVSDCGCFGDFIVISNTASLLKNIVLTAIIVWLLIANNRVKGLYLPEIQWLVATVTIAFGLLLAGWGYLIQPLVDFRPYGPGTSLLAECGEGDMSFVYTDGETQAEFSLDNLPDSTWTYVKTVSHHDASVDDALVIFDEDGDDVTSSVIKEYGRQVLLIVPDPGDEASLSRMHLAKQFNDHIDSIGGEMVAIIGANDEGRERWIDLSGLACNVYTAEPTTLKMLARGYASLVWVLDGTICDKRMLQSFAADYFDRNDDDRESPFDTCDPERNNRIHAWICLVWVASMLLIYSFNFMPRMLKVVGRKNLTDKKSQLNTTQYHETSENSCNDFGSGSDNADCGRKSQA